MITPLKSIRDYIPDFFAYLPLRVKLLICKFFIILFLKRKKNMDNLVFLLTLDNLLYSITGQQAVLFGGGVHPKHRLIRYHDFFIHNIVDNEFVLDIGCGNGALAYDIASHRSDVNIVAIDISLKNINYAKEHHSHPNITYIHGDALIDLEYKHYNTVILSNVLEHIEYRVEFLKDLQCNVAAEKYLIRVPLFDRDWRIPLKKELDIDYFLDSTHFTEYTLESFDYEIQDAGLSRGYTEIVWGEIWCVCQSQGIQS